MLPLLSLMTAFAWGHTTALEAAQDEARDMPALEEDDPEFRPGFVISACRAANAAQRAEVDRGNRLKDAFLAACVSAGGERRWCEQATRPNPASVTAFRCTYGSDQTHQLIHPDRSTWRHAFDAVKIVSELEADGISVCLINNWWRPEPYNANVGGARGRHPFGTSVDVKFCSLEDKENAFAALCRLRRQGRVKAVGYYPGSTVLHLGVGDRMGNTWGRACP